MHYIPHFFLITQISKIILFFLLEIIKMFYINKIFSKDPPQTIYIYLMAILN